MKQKLPLDFLKQLAAVKNKRAKTVIDLILQNGSVSTEDLKALGYDHPPRAARDVMDLGIPLVTSYDKRSATGRRMASYRFGDPSELRSDRTGGRRAFPKTFKRQIIAIDGSRCNICSGQFGDRYLQIDHRVPYEVGGDSVELDVKDHQLLDSSCNRAKSWSCEHCENWTDLKNPKICKTCYWATPESYEHIAMRKIRRLDVIWEESEIEDYDSIKTQADRANEAMPDFVKTVLRKKIQG